MTSIHQRPAVIEDRAEAGHWEGDLITGKLNRSAIGTLLERTTRYTVLVHLPGAHTPAPLATRSTPRWSSSPHTCDAR
jgi:transposase, IS30 family